MEIHHLLRALERPIQEPFVLGTASAYRGKCNYKLAQLANSAWLLENRCYGENHIEDFLSPLKQHGNNASIEEILLSSWNIYEFRTMLEILISLLDENKFIHIPKACLKTNIPESLQELKETVFLSHDARSLFHNFIQNNAVSHQDESVSECRFANITLTSRKIQDNCKAIEDADISDRAWSPESVRRYRKSLLDTLFSYLEKTPNQEIHNVVFHFIDDALISERNNSLDMDWGSLHHVLYGMCSGEDIYHSSFWLNPHSHFSYLCIAKYGLDLLVETYENTLLKIEARR